ncbi:alpha/beta fold hydrolase [Amycolatopsis sp. cmx-11-32]|uniref:alpha/beta fold hydrolase n=1 Tax=Amycolatopsis sp. cmx-11-32 TaxID=2785796 RepID=UPI0039E6B12F
MTEISLTLGDVTLRGTVTGCGPTVLLLHAGGERRSVWEPVAAILARQGLRTVAYDLRGHGDSSGKATTLRTLADDVVEMIGREPVPIVLVGASIGGMAAIAALAEPAVAKRVAGLVLVDVVPDLAPARARSWLDFHGLGGRHTHLVDDVLGSGPALFATAGALDLPILVVHAGRESPLSESDVRRLRAANRRVTVARVPAAGHLVARDAPEELARLVSAHAVAWQSAVPTVERC